MDNRVTVNGTVARAGIDQLGRLGHGVVIGEIVQSSKRKTPRFQSRFATAKAASERVITPFERLITFVITEPLIRAILPTKQMTYGPKPGTQPGLPYEQRRADLASGTRPCHTSQKRTQQATSFNSASRVKCSHQLAESNPMHRLPSYDRHTSRTERSLYFTLSLAAAALIGVTAIDLWRFAGVPEQTVVGAGTGTAAVIHIAKEPQNSTNLSSIQPVLPNERTRVNGLALPKS